MNHRTTTTDKQSGRPRVARFHLALSAALIALLVVAGCQQQPALEEVAEPTISRPVTPPLPTLAPTAVSVEEAVVAETPTTPSQPTQEATVVVPTEEPSPTATVLASTKPTRQAFPPPEGALVAVRMEGQVGVLIDELPLGMRDRVAEALVNRPDDFWIDLARRQIRLTRRRLNFRNFIYSGRGQLPLPPEALWSFELAPAGPARQEVDGHDLVITDYTFSSTLLAPADSPGAAEPALAEEGGVWPEPFVLPLDPDLLLQRTGNACLNEAGFPPNSFDSENAWLFFDYTCQADSGGALGCHRTQLPTQSCVQALNASVGVTEAEMIFERLPWDQDLAQAVRMGEVTQLEGPDLKVVGRDLEDNRLVYRYFPPDSCALAEDCVGGTGWRRLLKFSATVHNVGNETLEVGSISASDPLNQLFEYNSCHAHYHFGNYGDFFLRGEAESLFAKQAFCVESTNRLSNNEWSPLTHEYTCRNQGIQVGWVDEYLAGLDCQWVDVTDVADEEAETDVVLGFTSNPDRFLCEGTPVLDEGGALLWESSDLVDDHGDVIERPQCEFVADWDANNEETLIINLPPTGGFVTAPCATSVLGPVRNCGFTQQTSGIEPNEEGDDVEILEGAFACQPGRPVPLSCDLEGGGNEQVLRICEFSQVLGSGVACTHADALANEIVGQDGANLSFTCPFARDANEPGGLFALYTAPLFGDDEPAGISCSMQ